MTLEEFAAVFQLQEKEKQFLAERNFTAVMADSQECPEFVYPKFYQPLLAKIPRHGRELSDLLAPVSEQVISDQRLQKICHLLHYLWFSGKEDVPGYSSPMPRADALLGEQAGMLNFLVALGAYPLWLEAYRRLGVPDEYADASLLYMDGAIDEYRAGHDGTWGLAPAKLNWVRYYVQGKLFRIGRFEYMMQDPLTYLPAAYRDLHSGQLIALCRPGWKLRQDGMLLWRDEDPAQAHCVASLESDQKQIKGIPIDPTGHALVEQTVTLERKRFAPLYAPWDLVPGLHIPGGGAMTPEACADSFRRAREFFRRYFRREIPAVSCFSWIFNQDFEVELPDSNLAALMREVYLFPFPSVGTEGLQFVFGKSDAEWSHFPRDNSLRDAFHRLRESGKRLKSGGMLIDTYGIEQFGSQRYRQQWRKWPARG